MKGSVMSTSSLQQGGDWAAEAVWISTLLATAASPEGGDGSPCRRSLAAREPEAIPAAAHLHVFLVEGSAVLGETTVLSSGDVICVTESLAVDLVAGPYGAEVLI